MSIFSATTPYIQIRSNLIVLYSLPFFGTTHTHSLLNEKTYLGKTTIGTTKRIKRTIDVLLMASPKVWIHNPISGRMTDHQISFITLTIPARERHIEAHEGYTELLRPWLQRMTRKHSLKTYIWKAEFQKNGQLHYHIASRNWLHYQHVKDNWNNLLSEKKLLVNWFQEHGRKMPNSTDIHKLYKVSNVSDYLAKYLAKNDQDKETKGKIWGCSQNLKNAKYFSSELYNSMQSIYDHPECVQFDNCCMIRTTKPEDWLTPSLNENFTQYKKDLIRTLETESVIQLN